MSFTEDTVKTIFGLKLKQLRKERKLSLQNLSELSGLSVSYLNEIENGRKYPKSDKILALAKAFDIPYDKLVSLKVNRNLEPISKLMQSDVFNDIPFEAFGIARENVLRLMADAPVKVLAFINAITEMARNYNMRQEHFHFAALRSYQELNDNYFEEIEEKAARFLEEYGLEKERPLSSHTLEKLLKERFGYEIVFTDFADYPSLKKFRSVFLKGDQKRLLVNQRLSEQQRTFLFGKELGFRYLGMDERPATSSWHKAESFEKVLNNFLASYFSGGHPHPQGRFFGTVGAAFCRRPLESRKVCGPHEPLQRFAGDVHAAPHQYSAAGVRSQTTVFYPALVRQRFRKRSDQGAAPLQHGQPAHGKF